ncbi:Rne/Rng family ribonuclease [Paracoccus panacisoli]|uniref:Ribonuclease E n=1 Tax=Paracoccus panacisoli TaxID=1510163 RepID=A0ABV6T3G5_9RHOB
MAKKMLIDATHAEETRVVVADGTRVDDFDFETLNKRQLAGNIYLAKVTRVEPSLQAAFVDYGGNRHGFLAFAEIHPDYYQIPAADRRALIEEDRAAAEAAEAEESSRERRGSGRSRRSRDNGGERAERAPAGDAVTTAEIAGMEVIETDAEDAAIEQGFSAAGGDVVDPTVEGQGGDADAVEASPETGAPEARNTEARDSGEGDDDHHDDEIESVAEEDVAEEIRPARKPRARRYKIQEVIKVRQIMLVQVVKEERGNKGAALTTYLSLAGRYCVLMPNTARGGGISRKITNVADRKKLKEIAGDLEVPQGAGLIIRTAGSQRTRTEIKRDYEYLMRLWEQIRELTFKSMAPAPIYEEGDLIKRTIRDLYSKEIDEVWVEGERGYRTARDFMAMIMPDQVRAVKHYTDPMPLFARYQVEGYLSGMFNPVVQLKSGGYIVIGITEALVAIDVNSGRATKEGSIEETAYKTNCEAADEIARQLRLRDLAGLIVIDFIDMDERKNNAAVEKRFKDALKNDRARIQVGRISGFGLMEMSRQRLRPGMLESTTQPCAHCHGTGLIRSDDSMALTILRAIEEEGTRKRSREVLVKAPVAVANFLMNQKREHIAMIESRFGLSVRVEADPALISPDFTLEKFKTATRAVPEPVTSALSVDANLMARIDEAEDAAEAVLDVAEAEADEAESTAAARPAPAEASEDEGEGRGRRRRRRRRRGGRGDDETGAEANGSGEGDDDNAAQADAGAGTVEGEANPVAAVEGEAVEGETAEGDAGAKPRRRSRSRRRKSDVEDDSAAPVAPPVAAATKAGEIVDESRDVPAGVADLDEAGGVPANADGLGDDAPATEASAPRGDEAAAGDALDADEAAAGSAGALPEAVLPESDAGEPVVTEADTEATAEATPAAGAELADAAVTDAEPEAETADDAGDSADQPAGEPQAEASPAAANDEPEAGRPKRRGWWSLG